MTQKVIIYTDGACKGNPGIGGWGALLIADEHRKEIKGAEPETTNNRMELRAVIEALGQLKKNTTVSIFTDSVYVKNGMQQWLANWKKNNWQTAAKKSVKNQDLWKLLDAAVQQHSVTWFWIKGHSGDAGNERADQLANLAVEALQAKSKR